MLGTDVLAKAGDGAIGWERIVGGGCNPKIGNDVISDTVVPPFEVVSTVLVVRLTLSATIPAAANELA